MKTNNQPRAAAMNSHTIQCWSCGTQKTLGEIRDADGYCPECAAEIDLAEYYPKLASDYAALEAENAALKHRCGMFGLELENAEERRIQAERQAAILRQHKTDYMEAAEGTRKALEAECERLRVKLMVIASAEPARHGIEWAKAIAAEGNGEPYAKWREAIEERDAMAAELAAIKGQWIPVSERLPDQSLHQRVLVFTGGYDFNGEQVFDVKAETLNECFYADPDDQPEMCKFASHWMPLPAAPEGGEV